MDDPWPDLLFHHAKQRDLTLERPHPVGPKTELEHPLFFERLVLPKPHFAEATFTQFPFQSPPGSRYGLFNGWAPPQHGLLTRGDLPVRLIRIRWRFEPGHTALADFANLDGLFQALERITAVVHPAESSDAF